MDITRVSLAVDSTSVKTATGDLDKMQASGLGAEKATTQLGRQMNTLGSTVRTLATAFGAYKITQYVQDAAMLASRYETLGVVMENVGRNAGYSKLEMDSFAKGLQGAGIAMVESRSVLTKMAQAQLDLTQSSQLARIAQDAAVIGNINSSEAFDRLVHGLQSGQTEILRTIGINVNFEKSYQVLAATLHKSVASLTEAEKAQARMNVVMEAGSRISGTYEASMGTAGKQILSMTRYWDNLKVTIGGAFLEGLALGVKDVTGALKDTQKAVEENDAAMKVWSTNIKEGVAAAIADVKFSFDMLKAVFDKLPDAAVGAAGVGIIGLMLFGPAGAVALGGITFMIDQLRKLSDVMGEIDKGNIKTMGPLDAIFDKTGLLDQARKNAAQAPAARSNAAIMESRTTVLTGSVDDNFFGGQTGEAAYSRTLEGKKDALKLDPKQASMDAKQITTIWKELQKEQDKTATLNQEMYDEMGTGAVNVAKEEVASLLERAAKWQAAGADIQKVNEWLYEQLDELQAKWAEKGDEDADKYLRDIQRWRRDILDEYRQLQEEAVAELDKIGVRLTELDKQDVSIDVYVRDHASAQINAIIARAQQLQAMGLGASGSTSGGNTTNINVSQAVSRSDISNIAAETSRQADRS